MPAVSLLIPIYNVEKHIERCAISLFEQTFEDIEYIFVDDATPDNSIEILKKVVAKYPERKIKIVTHSENKGLAATRRTAIGNANAEYVLTCDSDDYIEPDMVQLLYEAAIKENADIAVCDFVMEFPDESKIIYDKIVQTGNEEQDRKDNFSNIITAKETEGYFWNKMIRRSMFDNPEIQVPQKLNYLEDKYVTLRLFYFANKIVKVDKALYHYVLYNAGSITKNKTEEHFKDFIFVYDTSKDFIRKKDNLEKYQDRIAELEIKVKLRMFWDISQASLRYKYSTMFDEDTKYLERYQKLSDRLMLCTARRKSTLWITSLLKKLVEIKQKIRNFVRITKIN